MLISSSVPLKHFVLTAIRALSVEWNDDFFWCMWLISLINNEFLEGKHHLLFISLSPGSYGVLSGQARTLLIFVG